MDVMASLVKNISGITFEDLTLEAITAAKNVILKRWSMHSLAFPIL